MMHTESDKNEIMIGKDTDKTIQKRFDSLIHRYQTGLKKSMKGSSFVFHNVNGLYYKCHK